VQRPEGYEITIKAGEIIFDNGTHTGALPGKLVRRSNEKKEANLQ
jgi:N-acyl-D-aspartate/D-glutamate deacylase